MLELAISVCHTEGDRSIIIVQHADSRLHHIIVTIFGTIHNINEVRKSINK